MTDDEFFEAFRAGKFVQICSCCHAKPVGCVDYFHWAVFVCWRCHWKRKRSEERRKRRESLVRS